MIVGSGKLVDAAQIALSWTGEGLEDDQAEIPAVAAVVVTVLDATYQDDQASAAVARGAKAVVVVVVVGVQAVGGGCIQVVVVVVEVDITQRQLPVAVED